MRKRKILYDFVRVRGNVQKIELKDNQRKKKRAREEDKIQNIVDMDTWILFLTVARVNILPMSLMKLY